MRSTAITVSVRRAVARRIGAERRQVDDRHLGHEVLELVRVGPDQQVADEQRVPGKFGDDPGRQAVSCVGAADQILHEQVLRRGMRAEIGLSSVSKCAGDIALLLSHQTVRSVGAVADDVLVLGRAAGVLPGLGDERAMRGEPRLAARGSPPRRARPRRDCSGPTPMVVQPAALDPAGRIALAAVSIMTSLASLPHLPASRRNGSRAAAIETAETEISCDIQIINRFKHFENCLNRL